MTFGTIFHFIQEAQRAGRYAPALANNLLTACRAVAVLLGPEEDSLEYVEGHLFEILARYPRLRPGISRGTLNDYRARARRAIADCLGRPASRRRSRPIPLMPLGPRGTVAESLEGLPPSGAPTTPYGVGAWSGTSGPWWPRAKELRDYIARRDEERRRPLRDQLRDELTPFREMSPEQRGRRLAEVCRAGWVMLMARPDSLQALRWRDPLPPDFDAKWRAMMRRRRLGPSRV